MNYSLSNRILEFSRVNQLAVSFQNANVNNKKMAAIDFRDPEILTFFQNLEEHQVKYILFEDLQWPFMAMYARPAI